MNKIQMTVEFDIPDWATYIAQDEDGMWFAYGIAPHQGEDEWTTDDTSQYIGLSAEPKDWKQEIYTLEWEYYL